MQEPFLDTDLPLLTVVDPNSEWRDSALCRGADVNQYFQDKHSDYSRQRITCAECPVRLDCLNFALDNGIKEGLWGGLPPRNRVSVKANRQGTDLTVTQIVRDLRRLKVKNPIAQASVIFKITEKTIRERLRDSK